MPSNESQEYINIGAWLKDKFLYHMRSDYNRVKRMQVNYGEIWYCDFGYNIGKEKNKIRPIIVISNNKVNRSEKVVVIAITDADGKLDSNNRPAQSSWYLLYSSANGATPENQNAYDFLDKNSVVQCEEIRSVSKARLDANRGCIGKLEDKDMDVIKAKFRKTFNL